MNHYPRHVGDYLRKTIGLTMAQDGAYTRMIDLYYSDEHALPTNRADLYADLRCRSKAERDAVDFVLRKFFMETEDGFTQKRCDEEIAKFADKSAKARAAGKASGNVRSTSVQRPFNVRQANVEQTLNQPVTSNQEPVTKNQEPFGIPSPSATVLPHTPKVKTIAEGVAQKPRPPPAATNATWEAYSDVYLEKHGVTPVRNRTTNAHLAAFIARVGATEAPAIAAYYCRSNRGLYVAAKHATNLLVRDAEALRTEWATQTHGTETQARQADKTAATGNVFNKLIEEARRAKG